MGLPRDIGPGDPRAGSIDQYRNTATEIRKAVRTLLRLCPDDEVFAALFDPLTEVPRDSTGKPIRRSRRKGVA